MSALPSPLSPQIEMGPTQLRVRNQELMQSFYTDLVGLRQLAAEDGTQTLGSTDRPVLHLKSAPHLSAATQAFAGLYHLAILFPTKSSLATSLKRILESTPNLFQGSADHLVSEAFYFRDPEGNGVELYTDRHPDTWQWQDGQVLMASQYLDPNEYIRQHGTVADLSEPKMGHVHLKVGSISAAHDFYVSTLGFAVTAQVPGALFLSDGAYHHHLGLNTWESAGAAPRAETLGLGQLEILLQTQADQTALLERLSKSGATFQEKSGQVVTQDPWGNELVFGVQA